MGLTVYSKPKRALLLGLFGFVDAGGFGTRAERGSEEQLGKM